MNELFENWSEVKDNLLDGLEPHKQGIVSQVLENQKNYILAESAASGAVAAHDIAGFRKILIPMIRRIIPGTIATEIVGVQPMQGPVGLVYTMRYRYGESVTVPAAGTAGNPWTANGALNDGRITAGDEFFGNNPVLRQFYSGAAGAVAINTPTDQLAGSSGITNPAGDQGNIGAFAARGSWPSAMPAHDTSLFGPYGPDALGQSYAGRLYGGSGSFIEGSGGRTMKLEVISQAVEAGSRKLQAGWTIEAMQDLKSQHGLNLESELSQVLSAEIVQEIDSEILSDLIALAGTVGTYDYATIGLTGYQPAYLGDRFANLGIIINAVANEIARKTRRGPGNFIVVSPMIVSVLQSASKSVFAPAVSGSFKGPNNTMLVGTLNGSIKVYSYLWNQVSGLGAAVNDTILVGYKGGNGETDTGYFYCPYIPLMSSGTITNPVTFQPVVSMMTRYGKTAFTQTQTSLGNSADYYGKVNVASFQFA